MLRIMLVSLALSGFGAAARAGELDREAGPAKPAAVAKVDPAATVTPGSEMDQESPAAAWHRRGYWGGGYRGYGGYGGWGWGGYRGYYGGLGYRGWGGYGGYGG